MELKKHLIICLIFVLLAFCSGAKAISCYSCNTEKDDANFTNCTHPFVDGKVETDCVACGLSKMEMGNLTVVMQVCLKETIFTEGCYSANDGGVSVESCFCMTDLCNNSTNSNKSSNNSSNYINNNSNNQGSNNHTNNSTNKSSNNSTNDGQSTSMAILMVIILPVSVSLFMKLSKV